MKLSWVDYISMKLHQTDLTLTSYMKAQLEPYQLAPEQNLIMLLLWESDGLTQYEIAAQLNKDKTNITRMCASLEKKGFIFRINCQDDRRSIKLFLTPFGKKLKKKIIPITEAFNEMVCRDFSEAELHELERLLAKINCNMKNHV